jgi:hypothetical protein
VNPRCTFPLLLCIGISAWAFPHTAPAQRHLTDAASSPVEWHLVEPFPLFRGEFDRLARTHGSSLITAKEFLARLSDVWLPGRGLVVDPDMTAYDNTAGRYRDGYLLRQGDLVAAEFRLSESGHINDECTWTVAEFPERLPVTRPCRDWATLQIPLATQVRVVVSLTAARFSVETNLTASQRVTVAMGDSYASGEGNPDVPAAYATARADPRPYAEWLWASGSSASQVGPPARWWDKECHRSLVSWPVLASLMHAIGDRKRQTRHVTLSYACSGAEMLNGIFQAQLDPPGQPRNTAARERDGEYLPLGVERPTFRNAVQRSQINAMFDDLCGNDERQSRIIAAPPPSGATVHVSACANPISIDVFYLSIGGNDIGFAPMAMGAMVPKEAHTFMGGLFLGFVRSLVGAESLDVAESKIDTLTPHYTRAIYHLLSVIRVSSDKATLVAYPNPIGETHNGCTSPEGRTRIRDSNLVMAKALPRLAFGLFGDGWTVEVSESEVEHFTRVFNKLASMQSGVSAYGMGVAHYATDSDLQGSRICDPQGHSTKPIIPLYFCGKFEISGKLQECDLCDSHGWCPVPIEQWRHYGRESRRSVYMLNDSVLALRPWHGSDPRRSDLIEALKGSMHPVAALHAAAAQATVDCDLGKTKCRPSLAAPEASSPK